MTAEALERLLRPTLLVELRAAVVSSDRCRRVRAGRALLRHTGHGQGEVRLWRDGREPSSGLTATVAEVAAAMAFGPAEVPR